MSGEERDRGGFFQWNDAPEGALARAIEAAERRIPVCGREECRPYTPGGPTPPCGRPECAPFDVEAGLARLRVWMREQGYTPE